MTNYGLRFWCLKYFSPLFETWIRIPTHGSLSLWQSAVKCNCFLMIVIRSACWTSRTPPFSSLPADACLPAGVITRSLYPSLYLTSRPITSSAVAAEDQFKIFIRSEHNLLLKPVAKSSLLQHGVEQWMNEWWTFFTHANPVNCNWFPQGGVKKKYKKYKNIIFELFTKYNLSG